VSPKFDLPLGGPGIAGIVGIQGSHPWLRSKAMLGSIVNIQRDRVSELQNPEPEKPLAPHWRVPNYSFTQNIFVFLGSLPYMYIHI